MVDLWRGRSSCGWWWWTLCLLAAMVRGSACPAEPHPDISWKAWEAPLVLEATARSRSATRPDGTYGVTFDLLRVLKGRPPPLLQRRAQFRLEVGLSCGGGGVKAGRKYILFVAFVHAKLVSRYPPEPLNRRNSRAVQEAICEECGEEPLVVLSGATSPPLPHLVVLVGEKLRLRCRVRAGNPVPPLHWYKDGAEIGPSLPRSSSTTSSPRQGRIFIRVKRRESVLVIRHVQESDVGLYRCEGRNGLGTSWASTQVVVTRTKATPNLALSFPPPTPEERPTTLWPIRSSPCPHDSYCLNGGNCSYYDSISEYVCQCGEGFKGPRCESKEIRAGPRVGARLHPEYEDEPGGPRLFRLLWS